MDKIHPTRLLQRSSILFLLIPLILILAGCFSLVQIKDAPAGDPSGRIVEIRPDHQSCSIDADCVLIYVDCSWCDCGSPINADYEEYYLELYQETCHDYAGPVCEIYCPKITLSCQQGICTAEPAD